MPRKSSSKAKFNSLKSIWHQVPPDYYQKSVKNNFLQRKWHKGKLKYVLDAIIESGSSPKKIIDVGCASGWFISEISKKFPKAKCFGIDIYKDAIDFGKKKYRKINFKCADAQSIPFKNSTFDVVICCEVLEHVENPKKTLLEIKRILKNDGTAVMEIDSGNFLFKIIWYWWTNLRKGVWRDSHIHQFDVSKLEKLFSKTGFKIKSKKIFNYSMAVVFVLKRA